jgi:isopentenyl-diphosphate delta-isomerase
MQVAERDAVVLVDEQGRDKYQDDGRLSISGKIEAHRRGQLHRAVSVFIFNDGNEILLQKRADGKYHSPEKWTNTCCTHPVPGESPVKAARSRLVEEMGIVTQLTEAFAFLYRADVGNGLVENEFDHVFVGVFNQKPNPDPDEVSDWKWTPAKELRQELDINPDEYSPWLRQCFSEVFEYRLRDASGCI